MENTCSFFGHRNINATDDLINKLKEVIEKLIVEEKVSVFLFGSKSEFNKLCHKTVTELKEKYSHIKRVYVRAEYPYINEDYKNYLLEKYEYTYYPDKILTAGKAVYIERNKEMIDKSKYCVFYLDEEYLPPCAKTGERNVINNHNKSGTKIAYNYAIKKRAVIINVKKYIKHNE